MIEKSSYASAAGETSEVAIAPRNPERLVGASGDLIVGLRVRTRSQLGSGHSGQLIRQLGFGCARAGNASASARANRFERATYPGE
jgi:hypothetical protein